MMPCPKCDGDSKVTDSRPVSANIRRRRKCISCGNRFSTVEVFDEEDARNPVNRKDLKAALDEITAGLCRISTRFVP